MTLLEIFPVRAGVPGTLVDIDDRPYTPGEEFICQGYLPAPPPGTEWPKPVQIGLTVRTTDLKTLTDRWQSLEDPAAEYSFTVPTEETSLWPASLQPTAQGQEVQPTCAFTVNLLDREERAVTLRYGWLKSPLVAPPKPLAEEPAPEGTDAQSSENQGAA